jgi:hypothetical protein
MEVETPYAIIALMLYVGMERGLAEKRYPIFGSELHIEIEGIGDRVGEIESNRYLDEENLLLIPERMDEGEVVIVLTLCVGDVFPSCSAVEGCLCTVMREIRANSQAYIGCEEECISYMRL